MVLEQPAARAPLGVGETLDWSLRLYRHAFLPVLGLSALFVLPFTVAILFISTAEAGDLLAGPFLRAAGLPVTPVSAEAAAGLSLVAGVGGLFLVPLVYCSLVRVADQVWRGETPSMGRALLWSLRRLFAMLVTAVLVLFAGAVLTLVAGVAGTLVMGISVAAAGLDADRFGLAGVIVVAGNILVITALFQAAWLSFAFVPQVIVVESRGYFVAIWRSMLLVWSQVFRSTGVAWSALLLLFSLLLSASLPVLLWVTAVGQTGLAQVMAVVQGAILLLTFPLLPLISTVAYYDLRLRREGHDLEARLQRLEGEADHA